MMFEILIFVLFQGLAINGFQQAMDDGMIFHPYKLWLQKRPKWFSKPMGLCVQCSASVGSIVSFWPAVLYIYGWKPIEVFAWFFDIFVLVALNRLIYKFL